jgi:putative acetyltransferase
MSTTPFIRPQRASDLSHVREVLTRAFEDPAVLALEAALESRPDSFGFVAVIEGQVVGHVRVTRGWIDAESRLVDIFVLSPLSVMPAIQRHGIGAALTRHAVEQADSMGAPAVFLEGSPAFYSRLGWRPAAELGVTPPSVRIPAPAFQAVRGACGRRFLGLAYAVDDASEPWRSRKRQRPSRRTSVPVKQ